ncbi:DNA repair protein RecO [uncultured Desulfatiglans sp.]|uniref:DNA repair protein RecO n=1 Tax=Uncultured Desulfatiglans sp. TaxID=1748965 RepID=A0A653ADZ4_UNCDX|nr:DNA repair protein RecO [uncultured Desulfatiglans sp.]
MCLRASKGARVKEVSVEERQSVKTSISPAIITRVRDFGEADLLVTFFTPERGCLKGVARAARRSRRRFPNCLDLFCLSRVEYAEHPRGGELHTMISCRLLDGFEGLRRDWGILTLAGYMVEVVEMLSPPQTADPSLFSLLLRTFKLLEGEIQPLNVQIFFEAAAMALGGYGIELGRCCSCGRTYEGRGRAAFHPEKGGIVCLRCGSESALNPGLDPLGVQALGHLQALEWDLFERMTLTREIVQAIERVNRRHMDYRLGRRPKSLAWL